MSTNYNILLKSENKLRELISSYLLLVLDIHNKLWKDAEKFSKEEKNMIFDNTERRQKRSVAMEEELLDECIWTISKDDPRANHLRFIITVIYATKDLSRSCEYALSIAKIIVRNNFDGSIIKKIKSTTSLYLSAIEESIKVTKSTIANKIDKIDEIMNDFETKFEKQHKEIKKNFEDEIIQYQINQIFRLISSTMEKIQSIFAGVLITKSSATSTIEIKKSKSK